MKKFKKLLTVILTATILGVFSAGAALAGSLPTTTSSNTPPDPSQFIKQEQETTTFFMSSLASTMGISEDTLTGDMKTAYTATIKQEVTDGAITQTQADKVLANLDKEGTSFFRIDTGHGPGSVAGSVYAHGRQGFGTGGGFMLLKPLADALSMDPKDVISGLQSGKTISDLATAKGETVDQIQSAVLNSVKSQFDNAVSDGKMTSDQESQAYSKLEQSISSGDWITQLQKMGQMKNRPPSPDQTPAQ